MHGGPLEPSVHLFSIRDLVQRKRKNKGQREFVHQVGAAPGQRPVTSPKAPPSTGGLPQRRPPLTPQPVVKVLI